jgi:methanogenic corrinoid protein MtbC1
VPDDTGPRAAYLAAIRAGDRRRAFAVVEDARAAGLDMAALYLEVLQPAMRDIGRLWEENEITVAEEHLATAITQMIMSRVYIEAAAAAGRGARTLVAACADTERHDLGLRMVCDLLERDGWDAVFLGAAVPRESLVRLVAERRPDALALSASIVPHLPQLRLTIEGVREAMGDAAPLIVVGGRPFLEEPGLARRLGADETAPDALAAAALLRERFG